MEEQKLLKRRRKAVQENKQELIVSVCTDLANLYMDSGRYDFAIEEYKTVAKVYQKQKKQLEYAVANRGIGEAYLGLQKFDRALYHQKIYLDVAREVNNKLEEQRALATIGHTYLSSYLDSPEPVENSLNLAHQFCMKSLVISQRLTENKVEIADMSARLFCNLGLVQECLGNFDEASELINKSINLCKIHDFYEQLQRGYMAYASLLVKKGDNKLAVQQYNLAAEAAKKIRHKPGILAGILSEKSEILIKLGDMHAAKSALLKAYKLKISNLKERRLIENNLRVVAFMTFNEDKLLVTDSTDYTTLKVLYEKMGDGCCELKQFDKAIDYYKKMLDAARKADMSESDLASCYYSLGETYKDNNQFDEAVTYFEKELGLCKSLKDRLNTLCKIADTKETAVAPVCEVQKIYVRAIEICQKEDNKHEEGRLIKRCIAYLRRQNEHSEAFKLEQNLAKMDYHSSDSENESSETPTESILGADIDLDALTDVSDESDLEEPTTKVRKRTKTFQVRRNVKGETQLHTACIKGQLNVVSHLLEQHHPVNVRDYCGWLPLHEACIHGHLEIVKLLLEKGAAINDRGGPKCEGITPLHDAASNGHLPIIQLLLKKGANAVAKTDEGETVLHFLKKWRSTTYLDNENQMLYESLVEQILHALEKAGHSIKIESEVTEVIQSTPQKNMRRSALIGLEDEGNPSPPRCSNKRRSTSFGLKDDDVEQFGSDVNTYKNTIQSFRRRNETKISSTKSATVSKRSALVSSNDVIDDWLEDDIGKSFKKRKTNSPTKSHKTTSPKKSNKSSPVKTAITLSPLVKSQSPRRSNEGISRSNSLEDFHMFNDESEVNKSQTSEVSSTQIARIKKSQQAKLINFGHTRTVIEPDSTWSPSINKSNNLTLTRKNSFDHQPIMDPTLHVDVRINKKLYRVPVLLSQITTHTIKWLADEAATRYAKKEYMIPTLELETNNGAILADEDPISLLFPMGGTQAEEVEARVIKWSIPAVTERYKEACHDMNVSPHDNICQILEEMSVNLDLSNRGLKGPNLAPLCKVLNRQVNLLELDISGNFLTNECFQLLGTSIASLENLHKLNLNCTGLLSLHVEMLIKNLSCEVSYKMTDLDVSDNFLDDQCFESLALLSHKFSLKKLNLSGNKFTQNIFCHSVNRQSKLKLDQIEDFNISDNDSSNDALNKILSWLNAPILTSLDVSRNSTTPGFFTEVLVRWPYLSRLKTCKVSRCHILDADLFNLLRSANSLEVLDASYNNDLTSISLRRLLESDVTSLNVYACTNILQYFTDFSKYLEKSPQNLEKGKTMKLTLPENCDRESEYLIQLWNEMYGCRTVVELGSRFLYLSLSK